MPYDLTRRLVVGVASTALFDLAESCSVFDEQGLDAYRAHQAARLDEPPPLGLAAPLIRRLLSLNAVRPQDPPVEVVLLSRNDGETGRRLFRALAHYGLDITRAAFTQGAAPHPFARALHAELFLSADAEEVRRSIAAGQPAGQVDPRAAFADDAADVELRVAFDFDGVLADDSAERDFQAKGVEAWRALEASRAAEPLAPGPLQPFLARLAEIQALERATPGWAPRLKTALVTARGAPAHERALETLKAWGLGVDQAFFLGGVEKTEILRALKPHIFFDDQRAHQMRAAPYLAAAHVPFGVMNQRPVEADAP